MQAMKVNHFGLEQCFSFLVMVDPSNHRARLSVYSAPGSLNLKTSHIWSEVGDIEWGKCAGKGILQDQDGEPLN